jgi:hypothetical protein
VRGEPALSRVVAVVHFGLGYLLALPLYLFATAVRHLKALLRPGRAG